MPATECIDLEADFTPASITVRYAGLTGNLPADYGNCLALWQADMQPYADLPLLQLPLLGRKASGSATIDLVEHLGDRATADAAYQVGYCTGGVRSSLAATVAAAGATGCEVTVVSRDAGGVTVYWASLAGNRAASNGNWVGLFDGADFAWDRRGLLQRLACNDEANQGHARFDAADLVAGQRYAVGYATGPCTTNLAAVTTFTF